MGLQLHLLTSSGQYSFVLPAIHKWCWLIWKYHSNYVSTWYVSLLVDPGSPRVAVTRGYYCQLRFICNTVAGFCQFAHQENILNYVLNFIDFLFMSSSALFRLVFLLVEFRAFIWYLIQVFPKHYFVILRQGCWCGFVSRNDRLRHILVFLPDSYKWCWKYLEVSFYFL